MGNTKSPKVPPYQTVVSTNPYAQAVSTAYGNNYYLNPFLAEQNRTIENTVPKLYQQLINPTLNNSVTKAKTQEFSNALNTQFQQAFENNLINPLSQRRMLRSSLVNDLANDLQSNQTSAIADFNTNQLENSLSDAQSLINFYMNLYKNNSAFGQNTLNNALASSSDVNSYNLKAYDRALNRYNSSMSNLNNGVLSGLNTFKFLS